MLAPLLIAFVLSFVGSMPIAGPVAVVVLSKGLDHKARSGLFVAIGAAFVEAVYAGLAFAGLTAMVERYPLLLPISRLFGCVILAGLGVYFLVRKADAPKPKDEPAKATSAATDLSSAFLGLSITALNPTLIVTWTAAVSAAHSTGLLRVQEIDALPFAAGVFAGIVTWFATMLWLLGRFQKKLEPATVDKAVRGMGGCCSSPAWGWGSRRCSPGTRGTDPLSTGNAPLSSGNAPLSTGNAPLSNGNAPLSTRKRPLPLGNAPLSPGNAPLSNGNAPLSTGNAPLSTGNAPLSTGNAPLSTGRAPLSAREARLPLRGAPPSPRPRPCKRE